LATQLKAEARKEKNVKAGLLNEEKTHQVQVKQRRTGQFLTSEHGLHPAIDSPKMTLQRFEETFYREPYDWKKCI